MPFSQLPAPLPAWLAGIAAALGPLLYVRAEQVPKLAQEYPWGARTKLQLAVGLVRWLVEGLGRAGRALWLAADGADAKAPLLKPAKAPGVVGASRPRHDADLRGLPPGARRRGQRGPPPTCGKEKISLAERAGQRNAAGGGWRACSTGRRRPRRSSRSRRPGGRRAGACGWCSCGRRAAGWRTSAPARARRRLRCWRRWPAGGRSNRRSRE